MDFKSDRLLEWEAYFCGEAESKLCYKHEFKEYCPVDDTDGMSGSPVFVKLSNQRVACYVLVGVHIRAKRFVSIEAIKAGIQQF